MRSPPPDTGSGSRTRRSAPASTVTYDRPAPFTAFEAISEAQKLAFSPIAFQASVAVVRLGILQAVADAGEAGIAASEVSGRVGIATYGVEVLLEMSASIGLVWQHDQRYVLDKMGHFLLNDRMTQVNMDFVADVCYESMGKLTDSIVHNEPKGLEHFGDWPTLYPGLTRLPEPARTSWFAFDHFYSAQAWNAALAIVFAERREHIVDIGGNAGSWAVACAARDPEVRVSIIDLPEQISLAESELRTSPYRDRITLRAADLLSSEACLPNDADVFWMSQFLDCFSAEQILTVLRNVTRAMRAGASLFVLELFCDRQRHNAAAYSLNATSLYFTCIANGTSRMYRATDMLELLERAGLKVEAQYDQLGVGHTLLHCMKSHFAPRDSG